MKSLGLIIATALATLTASAIAAPGAQADVYSCSFIGNMGPVTAYDNSGEASQEDGVENILADALNNEGDSTPVNNPLTDTDDGDGSGETTGQDGTYSFATAAGGATCTYVETGGNAGRQNGVYPATIVSNGEYNNVICGTAWQVIDDDIGGTETTSVRFNDPRVADITDADFRFDSTSPPPVFTSGLGFIDIRDANNADGESGSGLPVDGAVDLEPTTGNCVTTEVRAFALVGSFTIPTS